MPRREWPWVGGAAAVVFVAAFSFGDLPEDVGALIALALALNLVAAYALARKYVEGWLLFLAAQLAHVSYALTVADNRPRPPSMARQGLLGAGTAIAPSMALYYVAAGLIGVIGLATWLVDLRRSAGLPLLVRRYGSGVPPR
jgi:nicotinamide riboside transporter PnuC